MKKDETGHLNHRIEKRSGRLRSAEFGTEVALADLSYAGDHGSGDSRESSLVPRSRGERTKEELPIPAKALRA